MILYYLAAFAVSLAISLAITPVIYRLALRNGVVDHPGARKVHREAKPLMGGLAIFISYVVTVLLFIPLSTKLSSLLLGGSILLMVGVLDDIYDLKPLLKLSGQLAAASVLVFMNLNAFGVILDYMTRFFIPPFVTALLIVGWIALIMNAFNLIDGLDGLAAGTAVIIALALAVITLLYGNQRLLGLCLIGAGSFLGFLRYNFQPARIFMGDAGSMLLGFSLAALHLFAVIEPFSSSLVLGSAFIFFYPALDVTYAIYRRLRAKGNIFRGDQGHIHHILLRLGLTMRRVVLLLWAMSLLFASLAVFLLCYPPEPAFVLALGFVTVIAVTYFFRYLNRLSGKLTLKDRPPRYVDMSEV